ncbi:hypothetical protein [Mycobacteroides chelonae]|nr:hypothetical protein [Mycobacteroides chelonae]
MKHVEPRLDLDLLAILREAMDKHARQAQSPLYRRGALSEGF